MKRMWDKKALIKLIEEHQEGITPEALKEILKGSKYISVDDSETEEDEVVVGFDFTEKEDFKSELGLPVFVVEHISDLKNISNAFDYQVVYVKENGLRYVYRDGLPSTLETGLWRCEYEKFAFTKADYDRMLVEVQIGDIFDASQFSFLMGGTDWYGIGPILEVKKVNENSIDLLAKDGSVLKLSDNHTYMITGGYITTDGTNLKLRLYYIDYEDFSQKYVEQTFNVDANYFIVRRVMSKRPVIS